MFTPEQRNTAISFPRQAATLTVVFAYFILWMVGIYYHGIVGVRSAGQEWLSSLTLLLAGLVVIFSTQYASDLAKLIAIASLGFVVEVVGVRLAIPFGAYNYTRVLRPQLFDVPLVIALAWMVLVAYVKQMLLHFNLRFWIELVIAAAWMTALDMLIDPLAASRLGYWRWVDTGSYYGVPAHNFGGWFLASLLMFAVCRSEWKPNQNARFIGASILIFFTLVAVADGLLLVALIGCGLCLFHLGVSRLHKRTEVSGFKFQVSS